MYQPMLLPIVVASQHFNHMVPSLCQGEVNTVDFILISRPLKNDTYPVVSDPPHIFSHHACYCRQVSFQ